MGGQFSLLRAILCLIGVGPSPEQAHLHDAGTRGLGDGPQPEFGRLLPALQCDGQHRCVLPEGRVRWSGTALLRVALRNRMSHENEPGWG